ncbi:FAD/NAD(P)-binding oxidoreductase family protein [Striga asiatica]|uniref:FAD/NAD(P)-binding oxidoreductase family protein n=1 Tax=Striga asiatica TaxID=4170 RepID=A0A5A7RBC1_STRAF|nr:FAD/NAD(P)-binding oxidoreductase family protein [Striga asiatica]
MRRSDKAEIVPRRRICLKVRGGCVLLRSRRIKLELRVQSQNFQTVGDSWKGCSEDERRCCSSCGKLHYSGMMGGRRKAGRDCLRLGCGEGGSRRWQRVALKLAAMAAWRGSSMRFSRQGLARGYGI